jgi:tetratricopeptide (TPR) repeat protein
VRKIREELVASGKLGGDNVVVARSGRRGPSAPPESWSPDVVIDDGPVSSMRTAAVGAAERAASDGPVRKRSRSARLDPIIGAQVDRSTTPQRAARLRERLESASEALGRGRYDDARRMVQPVLRELPDVAFGHEIAGLAFYGAGQWRKAVAELELARQLEGTVRFHPILADCYRAMRRYSMVDELWDELRGASPSHDVMAEGRIVAAGARADQGDLEGALQIMAPARTMPKTKAKDHHVRQWYVIGDLLDRSGEIIEARRWFGLVASVDPDFPEVRQRLAQLGR